MVLGLRAIRWNRTTSVETSGTRIDNLNLTDNEVLAAVLAAARAPGQPGHDPARRIVRREHFRRLYQRHPDDRAFHPDAAKAIYEAACIPYNETNVYRDYYEEAGKSRDFPV